MAVIGSVYASLYASRLTSRLPAALPHGLAAIAHRSVGAALGDGSSLAARGHELLATGVSGAASSSFIDGLGLGCLVAGGVALAGAAMAAWLLPSFPPASEQEQVQTAPPPIPLQTVEAGS